MLGLLWLLAGSFILGGIVSLALAAYVGVLLLERAEQAQLRSQQAAAQRSKEYSEAVERGDVPFEPPPLDAQINGDHADLLRQAALYAPGFNAPRTRPPARPAPVDASSQGDAERGGTEDGEQDAEERDECLVSGWISLQMAGKRKTRQAYYAFVRDTELYYGPREGDPLDEYQIVGLDGCLVRMMENVEGTKLPFAVEISHNNRKVAGKSDYIYILTASQTEQNRWYHALGKICSPYEPTSSAASPQPKAPAQTAAASLLSTKGRMFTAFQELRGYKPTVTAEGTHGWVRIQREEDPKQVQKRFAMVKSAVLATYNTEKILAATEKWEVDLRGCTAELVQRPKNGIKLYRPACELTPGRDHVYLIADSAEYATLWHTALVGGTRSSPPSSSSLSSSFLLSSSSSSSSSSSAAATSLLEATSSSSGATSPRNSASSPALLSSSPPSSATDLGGLTTGADAADAEGHTAPPSSSSSSSSSASAESSGAAAAGAEETAYGAVHEFLRIETADWFNALTSRFWFNFRNSEELVGVIKTFLETKMKAKLAEKKLAGFLERIDVVDLSLGDFVPKMTGIKILPQRRSGELGIDLVLEYRGEDRPAFVKFSGNVWITQKTCIPFGLTATLHALTGKMHVHCAPWPAERFSLSFYSLPVMDIRLESVVGGGKRQLRNFPKLNALILNKLTNILVEKTVMPNRRYISIPRAKKRPADAPSTPASGDQVTSSPELASGPAPPLPVRGVDRGTPSGGSPVAAPARPPASAAGATSLPVLPVLPPLPLQPSPTAAAAATAPSGTGAEAASSAPALPARPHSFSWGQLLTGDATMTTTTTTAKKTAPPPRPANPLPALPSSAASAAAAPAPASSPAALPSPITPTTATTMTTHAEPLASPLPPLPPHKPLPLAVPSKADDATTGAPLEPHPASPPAPALVPRPAEPLMQLQQIPSTIQHVPQPVPLMVTSTTLEEHDDDDVGGGGDVEESEEKEEEGNAQSEKEAGSEQTQHQQLQQQLPPPLPAKPGAPSKPLPEMPAMMPPVRPPPVPARPSAPTPKVVDVGPPVPGAPDGSAAPAVPPRPVSGPV